MPKLPPDNMCPRWCANYNQLNSDRTYTEQSKRACKQCCDLDITRHGQSGQVFEERYW